MLTLDGSSFSTAGLGIITTAVLTACAPCGVEPAFVVETGHEGMAYVVESYVRELRAGQDLSVCLQVEITEAAPELGLSRRGPAGWELSVNPDSVSAAQINRHICALVLREQHVLSDAPPNLFRSGGQCGYPNSWKCAKKDLSGGPSSLNPARVASPVGRLRKPSSKRWCLTSRGSPPCRSSSSLERLPSK